MLVKNPANFVGMVEVVSWKLKSDDLINFVAIYGRQVQQSPHRHAINNSPGRVPLKRDGHYFDVMSARQEFAPQRHRMNLSAALDEGNLYRGNHYPHKFLHTGSRLDTKRSSMLSGKKRS